ncbi:Ig-like domain-containing protein [Litoribacter alkaliphilus]|uniref:Ig-like domain-containing protein n=1 Tax=Litoribacter ruber TaxID=702568 RepID=A0AAP2CHK8_9BACT|nr:Ig-like domain-containing protein [Litoribacter alkaliphilus]MBS9523391.1 Ig-like domain-containing protein [Litoribacter alkaliphilus]
MKVNNLLLLFIAIIALLACARESAPMGGPKDEEPPKLLKSDPAHESLNVRPEEINLEFSEFIKVENPNKQIIITPRINTQEMEVVALRNRVRIKLNQELEDSTTYVFNFQQSIKDITENNPAENLKLVFSTGNEIDSLKFSGRVRFVFPQKEKVIKDVLVGLYDIADTTDLFNDPPYYIAQADTSGRFEITNIKAGTYRAVAWQDENNTLKVESKVEPYAYFSDSVVIDENIDGAHFNLFRADLSAFSINRSSPTATNYDIVLSKAPAEINLDHPDLNDKLFYRLSERTIRLYHTEMREDSTEVRLSLKDTVGFSIDTALYATFEESTRNKQKLELTVDSGKGFIRNLTAQLDFNKPVVNINYDSLMVRYDTASFIPITRENLSLLDSSNYTKYIVRVALPDTLPAGTYTLFAADSTFQDVEGLWNENEVEANYRKIKSDNLSDEISGVIESDELPIILQLLNKRNEIVYTTYLTESNRFRITNIEAGEYRLRAIIDRNSNRRWDPGNYNDLSQPEPVYYYVNPANGTREFTIRPNWSNVDLNIAAIPETGLTQTTDQEEEGMDFEIEIPEFIIPEEL